PRVEQRAAGPVTPRRALPRAPRALSQPRRSRCHRRQGAHDPGIRAGRHEPMKRLALAWALLALSLGAAAQMLTPPPIAARAYFLVDLLSGTTLAAANDTDRVEPASLTKLMTAYLVFDAIRNGKLDP